KATSAAKPVVMSLLSTLAPSPPPVPAADTENATAAPAPPGRTVYLAEVTEDLDEARDDVRRYHIDAGYGVVPRSLYPRDPAAVRVAVDADLARADVYVQLLGPLPGRRLAEGAPSPVALQHERAVAAARPILQWRDRTLDLAVAAARNPLLAGADCLATG